MTPVTSAILGLVFLALGTAATFLMFWLWGFPFDKVKRKSEAPRSLMVLHRGIGLAYAGVYIFMMIHMVPRMWEYQVELPPRTVAHLLLGFSIGVILLIKVAIIRFHRHLEEWMPILGTLLFLCTVLLLGLSLPFALRERALAAAAAGGDPLSDVSRQSAAKRLAEAGLPPGIKIDQLTSRASLEHGRDALLGKCVKCHDLKTILAKPRTAADWWETVQRMEEKPAIFAPISDDDGLAVTAYLVAITPDLQRSRKHQEEQEAERAQVQAEATEPVADAGPVDASPSPSPGPGPSPSPSPSPSPEPPKARPKPAPPDPARAKAAFGRVCSGCHDLSDVDDMPPRSEASVAKLLKKMAANGMTARPGEVRLVRYYLLEHYVKKTIP